MIDTKLTRVDRNGDPWVDGGQVPLGFDSVLRTQPELIPDEELARIVSEVSGRGKGVLAISGVSSAGLLTLKESRASKMDGFEVFDFRLMHTEKDLDRCIGRDALVEGVDVHGDYLAFEVPANATIDVINRWLLTNYPEYCLNVDVTTHTSSGVGANVLTGLLGENRMPVEANGLTLVVDGRVETVRGKENVDAYRGTQGYAGIVKKVEIVARKRPVNPGLLVLPLTGKTLEETFAGSYARVLSQLAPWIYSERGGTQVSAADVLDLTGLQTTHRVIHRGDMSGFQIPSFMQPYMDAEHPSVICMRTEGPISPMENDRFLEALGPLLEAGLVGNVTALDKSSAIAPIIAARGAVPERAREEGGHAGFFSTSMDQDVKILFDDTSVDFTDERTSEAYVTAYQAVIRCYQPLEDLRALGMHFTWNGHFYMTNTPDYYVGGHNPHPRVTGPIADKEKMTSAKKQVTIGLNGLHGKKFGPFTICVQEGEKHYPHDALSQAHFAVTQPHWAAERARLTARAGLVHNARVPEAYELTMRRAGFSL